ncbi:hypothetical protein BDN67DRAFT_975375 [Paxillus ammoniavirescens]|nr:hypothetical protein BDN67DRAFT_975375 [Paxillus ammoniavirescens]
MLHVHSKSHGLLLTWALLLIFKIYNASPGITHPWLNQSDLSGTFYTPLYDITPLVVDDLVYGSYQVRRRWRVWWFWNWKVKHILS